MNPVLGAGKALIAIVARSRDLVAAGTVALLSVAETLAQLVRLGVVHDVREVKQALIAGMRARVNNQEAEALVNRANALRTITEAVVLTNHGAPASAGATDGAGRLAEAEANLKRALGTYALLGGTLSYDPDDVDRLRALLGTGTVLEGSHLKSTIVLPLTSGEVEISLSGSAVGTGSASAELTTKRVDEPRDTPPERAEGG